MNRIIVVSRSVVEMRPYVSSVLFPQVTILTLYFSGLMLKNTLPGVQCIDNLPYANLS